MVRQHGERIYQESGTVMGVSRLVPMVWYAPFYGFLLICGLSTRVAKIYLLYSPYSLIAVSVRCAAVWWMSSNQRCHPDEAKSGPYSAHPQGANGSARPATMARNPCRCEPVENRFFFEPWYETGQCRGKTITSSARHAPPSSAKGC